MNINNFDLNLLRAFDALMRERNVSRAAERVSISQPAMSNALARLRTLLDDPVLVRTTRGMQPTPRALVMEKPVRLALKSIENTLLPEPDFEPATSKQVFRLLATDYLQFLLLPRLIRRLHEEAPSVHVKVQSLQREVPEQELEEGEYDYALGLFRNIPKRLSKQYLLSDTLVVLVGAENKAYGDRISREEFLAAKHVWVSGGQRTDLIDQVLTEQGLNRQVALTTPNFLMGPVIAANTDLIVVTPRVVANQYIRYLPLKMLPVPFEACPFDLHLLWHPHYAETPAHRWFRNVLDEVSAEVRERVA